MDIKNVIVKDQPVVKSQSITTLISDNDPKKTSSLWETFKEAAWENFKIVATSTSQVLTMDDGWVNISKEKNELNDILGHEEIPCLAKVLGVFFKENLIEILALKEEDFLYDLLRKKEHLDLVLEGTTIYSAHREIQDFIKLVQEHDRIFLELKKISLDDQNLKTEREELESTWEITKKSGDIKQFKKTLESMKVFFKKVVERKSMNYKMLDELFNSLMHSYLISTEDKKLLEQQKKHVQNAEVFQAVVVGAGNYLYNIEETLDTVSEKLLIKVLGSVALEIKKLIQIESSLYDKNGILVKGKKEEHEKAFFNLLIAGKNYLYSNLRTGVISSAAIGKALNSLLRNRQGELYEKYCKIRQIDKLGQVKKLKSEHQTALLQLRDRLVPKVMDVAFDLLGKKGKEKLRKGECIQLTEQFSFTPPKMLKMSEAISNLSSIEQEQTKQVKKILEPFLGDFLEILVSNLVNPKLVKENKSLFETVALSLIPEVVQFLVEDAKNFNKDCKALTLKLLNRFKIEKKQDLSLPTKAAFESVVESIQANLQELLGPLIESKHFGLICESALFIQNQIEKGANKEPQEPKEPLKGVKEFSKRAISCVHPFFMHKMEVLRDKSVRKTEINIGLKIEQPLLDHIGLDLLINDTVENTEKLLEAGLIHFNENLMSKLIDPNLIKEDRSLFQTVALSLLSRTAPFLAQDLKTYGQNSTELVKALLGRLNIEKAEDLSLTESHFNLVVELIGENLKPILEEHSDLIQKNADWIEGFVPFLADGIMNGVEAKELNEELKSFWDTIFLFVRQSYIHPSIESVKKKLTSLGSEEKEVNEQSEKLEKIEEAEKNILENELEIVLDENEEEIILENNPEIVLGENEEESFKDVISITDDFVEESEKLLKNGLVHLSNHWVTKVINRKFIKEERPLFETMALSILDGASPFLVQDLKACGEDYPALAKALLGRLNIEKAQDLSLSEPAFNLILTSIANQLEKILKPHATLIQSEKFEWISGLIPVFLHDVTQEVVDDLENESEAPLLSEQIVSFLKENFVGSALNSQKNNLEQKLKLEGKSFQPLYQMLDTGIETSEKLLERGLKVLFNRLMSVRKNTKEFLIQLTQLEQELYNEQNEPIQEKKEEHQKIFCEMIRKGLGEGLPEVIQNKLYDYYYEMRQFDQIKKVFTVQDITCQNDLQTLCNEIVPKVIDVGLEVVGKLVLNKLKQPIKMIEAEENQLNFVIPELPIMEEALKEGLSIPEIEEDDEQDHRDELRSHLELCVGDIASIWVNKVVKEDFLNKNKPLFEVIALSLIEDGTVFLTEDLKNLTGKELVRALFKRLKIEKARDLSLPKESLFENLLESVGVALDKALTPLKDSAHFNLVCELAPVFQNAITEGSIAEEVVDEQVGLASEQIVNFIQERVEVRQEEAEEVEENLLEVEENALIDERLLNHVGDIKQDSIRNGKKLLKDGLSHIFKNALNVAKGFNVKADKKGYLLGVGANLLNIASGILKGNEAVKLEDEAFITELNNQLVSLIPDLENCEADTFLKEECAKLYAQLKEKCFLNAIKKNGIKAFVKAKLNGVPEAELNVVLKAYIDRQVRAQMEGIKAKVRGLGARYGIPGHILKGIICILALTIGLVLYFTIGKIMIWYYHKYTNRLAAKVDNLLSAEGIEDKIEIMMQQLLLQGLEQLKNDQIVEKSVVERTFNSCSTELRKNILGKNLISFFTGKAINKMKDSKINELQDWLGEDGNEDNNLLNVVLQKSFATLNRAEEE